MPRRRRVYRNGGFIGWEEATVHLMSHSVARGATIFEVIRFEETARGPAVFRLRDHIARFENSARLLSLPLAQDRDTLCRAVAEAVSENGLPRGIVKLVGYHAAPKLDVLPPAEPLEVAVFVLDPTEDLGLAPPSFEAGVTAVIAGTRKLDPRTVPVAAKAAANYLNGMVAALEARRRGADLALLLDPEGFLAEGATESLFLVQGGGLRTPPLGGVLDSITRRSLLAVARHLGIEAREERLPPEALLSAEEVFFACTPFPVIPVRRIEDRDLPGTPGPVARRLRRALEEIASGREPAFAPWLHFVRP
ncbi:MAG: aminotransferase class IV [Desulfobacterales bacterium]